MRKATVIILCMLLVLCMALPMQVYAAPKFSVTTSAKTVSPGGSFTAYINGTECVGRVNISVSNGKAAQSAVWVENNKVSVKITAGESGSVKVTATPEAGMSDMNANEINPGAKSATVTIKASSGSSSGTTSNSNTNSKYKVGNIEAAAYTGSEIKPAVSVTYEGKALKEGTDYTVKYENNTKAGIAKVIVTGKGSHKFSVTKTFEISAKDIGSASVANIGTQQFTGGFLEPEVVIKDGSKELVKGTDYTVTYKNNVSEGTATVEIKGIGNYKGTSTANFEIAQKLFGGYCKMHIIIPLIALIGVILTFVLRNIAFADIVAFVLVGVASVILAFVGGCEGDWLVGIISVIVVGAEALTLKALNK